MIEYLTTVGSGDWRLSGVGQAPFGSGERRVDGRFDVQAEATARWLILLFSRGGRWRRRMAARDAWPFGARTQSHAKDATRLPENTEMEAYLGQRLSEDSGDVDLFEIEHLGTQARAASIEVSSIPNMDVIVELLRPAQEEPSSSPIRVASGRANAFPTFPSSPVSTLIRVRERSVEGALPTENVSDEYYVRWRLARCDGAFERELNDSLELAEPLALGTSAAGGSVGAVTSIRSA